MGAGSQYVQGGRHRNSPYLLNQIMFTEHYQPQMTSSKNNFCRGFPSTAISNSDPTGICPLKGQSWGRNSNKVLVSDGLTMSCSFTARRDKDWNNNNHLLHSLFRNKRFALNEMFQQNASKLIDFMLWENPGSFFFNLYNFKFSLFECPT